MVASTWAWQEQSQEVNNKAGEKAMTARNWREEIDEHSAFLLMLAEGFYGSVGEEQLDYAIEKKMPVVLVMLEGREIPVPEAFTNYDGLKNMVTSKNAQTILNAVNELLDGNVNAQTGWNWDEEGGGKP